MTSSNTVARTENDTTAPKTALQPATPRGKVWKAPARRPVAGRDAQFIQALQTQSLKICISAFSHPQRSVRSLGFTSAVAGEGKTLMALLAGTVLATQGGKQVTIMDCNWEHPCIHEHYGMSATPGLAEWLRDDAHHADISLQVNSNLSVIPAGNAANAIVPLLETLRQMGLQQALTRPDDLIIVDLPPVVTSAYGSLAARLVDAVILVVQSGVTPSGTVAQACGELEDLPIEGVLLNQTRSNIPHWLQRLL